MKKTQLISSMLLSCTLSLSLMAKNQQLTSGEKSAPRNPEGGAPAQTQPDQQQAQPEAPPRSPAQRKTVSPPGQGSRQDRKPRPTARQQIAAQKKPATRQPIVIRGGKLLTITHGTIENGAVVMENGKITAVGAAGSVSIPRNAQLIDAKGMTIYPGFIDSETHLGLTEIEAVDMSNDLVETSDEIMPHMHVSDAFHAESERIPIVRVNGVTNLVVAPSPRDTLPGQDILVQLAGRDRDEMILVTDLALPLNFSGDQRRRGGGGVTGLQGAPFPSTRMGMAAQLRQTFIDAQDYMRRQSEPQSASSSGSENSSDSQRGRGARGGGGNKRDLKLEALIPYLQGKKPVVIGASEGSDLKTAMRIAKEFNLKVVLNHVTQVQEILDEVASWRVPVIVGPIYVAPKANERYDAVFKLPAELYKRGVKIAFASYNVEHNRNLPYVAGYAVAWGLPYDEALKAITLNPAEIWGVADQLGSLDVGKTANVVVADGDPLDVKSDVKHVFIAGKEIPMDNRQIRLRDQYSK